MNGRTRFALAAVSLFLLIGCRSDSVSPPAIGGPMFAVSDGAHDGNPDFFFLPPLFKSPVSDADYQPAAFNGRLRPSVEICELDAPAADGSRDCVAGEPFKRFGPSSVTVDLAAQQYQVNWKTSDPPLNVNRLYRIRVLIGTTQLGFADVDPVSTGKELKNVQTGEYIGLVDGSTLPIKFRVENGALCTIAGRPCAAGTINLNEGGGIELVTEDEDFHFDIAAGTQATFGGQPVTNVTFNLQECAGIDVDLPKFGDCLRVTTYFDVAAGGTGTELQLSNPALISLCVLEPGLSEEQEDLVTLHQQDGNLIRALPHATPNCTDISSHTPSRGTIWSWFRDIAGRVLMPQPAYARARSVMFNLGGGGNTGLLGATCDGASPTARGMLLVECPGAVAPQMIAAAVITPPRTVSDFQFALPAKMTYVNPDDASRTATTGDALPTAVKVTDWHDAPVQGATVTFTIPAIEGPGTVIGTAVSSTDGIAQVDWTILAGPNAVVASGRGIAAQNNYPAGGTVTPFMPDITVPTMSQTAVVLRTGVVPFAATGVPPMGSLQFAQQPANTVSGDAIAPPLQIRVFDPSGAPLTEIVRVTVGNDPANPPECQVLQTSELAIDGVATFSNVLVNGACTGARVAATAGGADFDFPIIFSEPFDILAPVTGLLLRYQFDGNLNNSGLLSGYTGTATSVTFPEGRFGSAIKFDATAATGAQFPGTAAVFARGSQWTISLWFMEDAPAKAQSLLWEFRAAEGVDSYHGVAASGGDQVITTCSDGGCFSFPNPTLGVWHNVIYRYDGPSTTVGGPVDIYVDGALVGTITNAAATPIIGSQVKDIRMGSEGAGSVAGPSRFYIDEYRVYNQVFTQAQQCTDIIGGTWTGENCVMP